MRSDDSSRHRVEHGLFYREINNMLAIGGSAGNGEDKFGHWRSELVKNGFMRVPMSRNSMTQARLVLNRFPLSHGYGLVRGDGTLKLGWKDTGLYSVLPRLHLLPDKYIDPRKHYAHTGDILVFDIMNLD